LFWASELSGTYFKAQDGPSHLTLNRIASFNAKNELGALTVMETQAAVVAHRPSASREIAREDPTTEKASLRRRLPAGWQQRSKKRLRLRILTPD